ncbi:hypothetical protein JCM9533A_19280 [Catenuloplanes niger JCM 9533]
MAGAAMIVAERRIEELVDLTWSSEGGGSAADIPLESGELMPQMRERLPSVNAPHKAYFPREVLGGMCRLSRQNAPCAGNRMIGCAYDKGKPLGNVHLMGARGAATS